jgi:hypothetical protein
LKQAHEALFDTQQAMMQLPPELYQSEGTKAQPNYTVTMDRLMQGAQKLRESVQAMAQQPAGPGRNAAAAKAREALGETQQAMIDLPPQMRSQLGAELTGDERASAQPQASQDPFARLDRNADGRISRDEWQSRQ